MIATLLEGDEVVSPSVFLKANINKAILDHSVFFLNIIIIFIIFLFLTTRVLDCCVWAFP